MFVAHHALTSLFTMPTSTQDVILLNQHLSRLDSDRSERNGEFRGWFSLPWYNFHYSHFVPIS